MTRLRVAVGALLMAGSLVAMSATTAAASDGGVHPTRLCIPILLPCDTPSPSPTPSTSPLIPGLPVDPAVPVTPPLDSTPVTPSPAPSTGTTPAPQPAVPDDGAPVFTQPSAQLGSTSLSFTGLKSISVVSVRLADGSRTTALRLSADSITIEGFALTVRRATGPALVTTADRMTLSGHVQVYVNSLTATTASGGMLTLGADTPPPADGVAPGLLRVTLGLVGSTADSITYTNTDQRITTG